MVIFSLDMICKNCHTELVDAAEYCHNCGAKVIRKRLTIRNLFEHVSETFFNYDNKLLRTFIDLFRRPEEVLGLYVSGVRKRYVNPVSYFGLAITITGIYMLAMSKYFPEMMDFSSLAAKGQEEMQRRNAEFLFANNALFMMLYIPLYAIIARITFIGLKQYNYTELLVIFMYLQAQLSLTTSIVLPVIALLGFKNPIIGMLLLPVMIIYNYYCLKRLYKLDTIQMLARTLLFLVILVIVFLLFTVVLFVFMMLNGDFEQLIEAQKQATQN